VDAAALAAAIGAILQGEPATISGAASLASATSDHVAPLLCARWRKHAGSTRAAAVVCTAELAGALPPATTRLVATDARDAWGRAVRALHPRPTIEPPPRGVHPLAAVDPTASVDPTARVGPFVTIGPGATIGPRVVLSAHTHVGAGARLGPDTTLHPHAAVLDGCTLGARVLLCTGASIGSPGFGIDAAGRLPHLGAVRIDDDVTIGAQTCVDRGALDDTHIGRGAHLDNLVQVGHNAHVGPGALLCGQVGLAGGARVEAGAVLAGQAGVERYTTVGRDARVAAKSGVTRDLPAGGTYSGFPAEPNRDRLRREARLRRLARET